MVFANSDVIRLSKSQLMPNESMCRALATSFGELLFVGLL